MRSPIAVVAAAGATTFLLPFTAAAEAAVEEPVRLEYHAPPTCHDDARFFARARSRAPRMRIARPDERARMFVVEIEQRGSRTSARLTVRDAEGHETVREIEAKDCHEAVEGLALIVALAVNPRAGAPEAPPASEEAPSTLPAADGGASALTTPTRSPVPAVAATHLASPREASPWIFRAGLAGFGIGAIAPEPLFGARATAEILNLGEGIIAPSFRASLGYATRGGFEVEGGTAHFAYGATNLEICPLRIPPAGALALRPCVIADIGFVRARGEDALNPRGETRPWADIGATGRLEWMLGPRIGVDLDVGCMFPIWRDRFLFGSRSFHRVAFAGGVAALGLVMRIP